MVPSMAGNRSEKGHETKKNKELGDIIDSVMKLQENSVMPLVLASSDQILRNPAARGSIDSRSTDTPEGLVSRMMNMEEVMTKFIDTTATQLSNLSSEVKKVTEAKSNLAAAQNNPRKKQSIEVFEETEAAGDNNISYAGVTGSGFQPPGSSAHNFQPNTRFQPVGSSGRQNRSSVLVNLIKKSTEKENPKQKGRNVFHGNSRSKEGQSEETFLAADVTLVASGLGLGVNEQDLVDFLETKNIKTVKVECITRKELIDENKVRSKTMKVVVKASDHEKAMNPDIWPFRVGVRYFRAESRKPGGPYGLQLSSQGAGPSDLNRHYSQEAGSDGSSNHGQRTQHSNSIPGSSQWANHRNRRQSRIQNTDITMNNLYKVLSSPETQELLKVLGASSNGP